MDTLARRAQAGAALLARELETLSALVEAKVGGPAALGAPPSAPVGDLRPKQGAQI